MNKRDQIFELLEELKLRGIKDDYDEVVGQGIQKRQSFENILLNLLKIELSERKRKSIQYQLSTSKVPTVKNLDQFDFGQSQVNEDLIRSLAACQSRQHRLERATNTQFAPDRCEIQCLLDLCHLCRVKA